MDIIFLHGLTGSNYNFNDLKARFPNAKAFDIIGFASEEKPNTTYDKKLYMTFLEGKIKDNCIIVGHSMGAMLAKDFALEHPALVKRIYLLSYPLQNDKNGIKNILNKDIFIKFYMTNSIFSRLFCKSKAIWKYFILIIIFIVANKTYLSTKDYFKHTYNSVYSSIVDYIEQDDWKSIQKVKDKTVFISGSNDFYVDITLLKDFKHYTIAKMGHLFFGYEEQIVEIIKLDMDKTFINENN